MEENQKKIEEQNKKMVFFLFYQMYFQLMHYLHLCRRKRD